MTAGLLRPHATRIACPPLFLCLGFPLHLGKTPVLPWRFRPALAALWLSSRTVATGRAANRFLIGAAVLSVLSAAAGDRPLLCLVDDAGWLDYESAVAIAFAARRLEAEAVVAIVAARSVAGTPFAGFPAREIEGLSRSQAETLLAARHPRVDPLVRERVIERADGNPLALLEFASRLQDAAQPASPFPVGLAPTAVESLYLAQVRRLPDDTQLLLLVAAAEDSQALGLIIRAGSRLGLEPRALDLFSA